MGHDVLFKHFDALKMQFGSFCHISPVSRSRVSRKKAKAAKSCKYRLLKAREDLNLAAFILLPYEMES
jgi:hypothetical protein